MLAGCSIPGLGGKNEQNSTPQTLKVMYYDESSFYQEYGMLYSALYPNVDIEVLSTNDIYRNMNTEVAEGETPKTYEELLAEFIAEKQPDVIISDSYSIKKSIEQGLFYDLDALVSQDSYDLEGLGTSVVDYMKELGSGILYGIPTSISSQVIFYNKDVFDAHNVPYPTDNMTWSEVFALANMFPTEGEYPDRVYGLRYSYMSNLADLISQYANAQGLKMYDLETLSMTIDTPAWRELIDQATTLYNSGTLYNDEVRWNYTPEDYNNFDHYSLEPLLNGITAMYLESSYYLSEINYAKQYAQNPENLTDNWDIVSAPVASSGNNASPNTYYGNIMSIASNSTNVDAAWDFIAYVTGDEFARVKSYASYGNLPIRQKYALKDSTKNVNAFYATKPMLDAMEDWSKIPQRFSNEFWNVQREEFQKLQDGTATVDEVLATLQLKGNELLATGVMSEEELQKYYEEQYGEDFMGVRPITTEEVIVEEEIIDEVVE